MRTVIWNVNSGSAGAVCVRLRMAVILPEGTEGRFVATVGSRSHTAGLSCSRKVGTESVIRFVRRGAADVGQPVFFLFHPNPNPPHFENLLNQQGIKRLNFGQQVFALGGSCIGQFVANELLRDWVVLRQSAVICGISSAVEIVSAKRVGTFFLLFLIITDTAEPRNGIRGAHCAATCGDE